MAILVFSEFKGFIMNDGQKNIKALLFITGRGLGGDAVIALNIIKELSNNGVNCEIALDESAPGLLFKKKGLSWHKIAIPQAGGHAASGSSTLKAGTNTLTAVFKARKLIKDLNIDLVVGVIGGGAVIGCLAAKLAKVPAIGILSTPLDTKVCTKLNDSIIFPENPLFDSDEIPDTLHKSFFPINRDILKGTKENALMKMGEHCKKISEENPNAVKFDESKKTILFSSGSTLFEKTAKAISNYSKIAADYNLVIIGDPLEKEYLDWFNPDKIINLGYIDWIADLYTLVDCAVLTDDGLMLHEAMACNLPTIILTKVKYGRYHDMASIFKGATIEADLDNLEYSIDEIFSNLDNYKYNTAEYADKIIDSTENIANIILKDFNE